MHTYIHTYVRTYMHTYIYMYVQHNAMQWHQQRLNSLTKHEICEQMKVVFDFSTKL